MLFQLGSVTFEVWPFNVDNYTHQTGYDFAVKETIGNRKPREGTGIGDEYLDFSGKLFPEKLGGTATMDVLQSMLESGSSHILVRGDGRNMGWFIIEKVRQRASHINREGVGRLIEFDIALTRADKPTPASYIATLLRILS